ncbi:Flp pilus assembly secretin CpaC [Devosia sp. UYZn731]|uniref:pilus assembly protein N-terminal domain-containing protein n=1 Tax=Devosia sp. UYZn731 TaxID=3156345 RepID=UPI003395F888
MAKFTALVLLLSLALAASPVSAWAEEDAPITVNVNMARVLRINSPAATVIVGNPGIADVTIQDPQTLVLTGKSFGQTNLIVLDGNGNPVADTLIDVVQLQAGTMTVYQGAARTSLACAPVCQPTIMLGDENTFTSTQVDSANMIKSTAGQ